MPDLRPKIFQKRPGLPSVLSPVVLPGTSTTARSYRCFLYQGWACMDRRRVPVRSFRLPPPVFPRSVQSVQGFQWPLLPAWFLPASAFRHFHFATRGGTGGLGMSSCITILSLAGSASLLPSLAKRIFMFKSCSNERNADLFSQSIVVAQAKDHRYPDRPG